MNYLSSRVCSLGILSNFIVNSIVALFGILILEQRQRIGKETMGWETKHRMNGRIIAVLWLGQRNERMCSD